MVAPNLPTFMGTAYGWASRHHSHWYLNIDCLTCPWGRENLQKEGRSGTEDWQEFNFVSHWLRSPQCTEFLPFTEEEMSPQQDWDQDKYPPGSATFAATGPQKGCPELIH